MAIHPVQSMHLPLAEHQSITEQRYQMLCELCPILGQTPAEMIRETAPIAIRTAQACFDEGEMSREGLEYEINFWLDKCLLLQQQA